MDSRRYRATSGFTLVELLVVIAVICLLASMLLPVFASARAASRNAVCQSNLKQLYGAFFLYAADWDGRFPCPGGLPGDLTYWAQGQGGGIDAYLKSGHLGLRGPYCCPSYTGKWNSPYLPRTYGMNSFLREPPDIDFPGSLAYLSGIAQNRIKAPAGTILLYEGIPANSEHPIGEGYVYRCGNWTCVRGYYRDYPNPQIYWQDADRPWHGQRNNYLMSMEPERHPFPGPTPASNLWYARKLR